MFDGKFVILQGSLLVSYEVSARRAVSVYSAMTVRSFSLFFGLLQIDTTHFVLVISPFVGDIQQKSNGVPVETGSRYGSPVGRVVLDG